MAALDNHQFVCADWKTWCRLCGNLEANVKIKNKFEEMVLKENIFADVNFSHFNVSFKPLQTILIHLLNHFRTQQ
jgi:predicted Abi (CAAX) family protease